MDKLSNDIDRVNERLARAYEEHSSGEKNCYTCKQSIINHAQTGCKKSVMDVCGNTTVPYGAVRWQHWEAKPDKAVSNDEEYTCVDKQPDNTLVLHYEFKPCPFCGEPAILKIDKCTIKVTCAKCSYEMQASFTGHGYPEPNKIIEVLTDLSNRWNARA